MRTCFKREYDAQKNEPSGSAAKKRRKYLYFDQLLFLRESVEYRNTYNNLEHNLSESEDIEEPSSAIAGTTRPSSKSISRKISTNRSYEESLLQLLREKKDEEKDIDDDKYFLLSLLPAFKKFSDDQKFYARTEILHVMRRVQQSGSQNKMQQATCQLRTAHNQYFLTTPRQQFEEVLSPTSNTSQDAWENMSGTSSILNLN